MTDRQWHQIRAALTFWNAVAGSSRVHPMEHPAVRGFFGGPNPTPLTPDEIEALLLVPKPFHLGYPLITLTQMCKNTGISRERLQRRLDRKGVTPREIHGRVHFYDATKLAQVARTLLDELPRRRHVESKSKTP